ncbi:HAMP domain-containing protein [Candidatus Woesearchaeota archaeon]|jgi:hypothetical protein|nr:HAMP domain-containing protein [Candidatus Woesearchaeota archaeon]MBT4321746.1 HAMP domain-containing protein [Candidatus Woesearchaeota archaeon]MBT4631162.1 HAMP domain-containing protein [Candidatus Woesearchaeota archaeon]
MKTNMRILIGFSFIIVLVILMASINSHFNKEIEENFETTKDVEAPLEIMVEKVIGYDAVLTGNAHGALLHALTGEWGSIEKHETKYNIVGIKMDKLLKVSAPQLIAKSKRSEEEKNEIYEILHELDEVNMKLVNLETLAFEAMNNKDPETAYSLIVSDEYHSYKNELSELYQTWAGIEKIITTEITTEITKDNKTIESFNLIFSIVIIILCILSSFIVSLSISRPIKKMTGKVNEITKGNLDIQLEKSGIYEIQKLIDSLNRILASLKLAILRTGASKGHLGLGETIKAKEEIEEKLEEIKQELPVLESKLKKDKRVKSKKKSK